MRCLALIALLLANPAYAAAPASTEAPEAHADRLLSEARQAMGGSIWEKVKSLHIAGKLTTDQLDTDIEQWLDVTGGKMLVVIGDGPQGGRTGFDGKIAWTADLDGAAHELKGADRAEIVTEAYRTSLAWALPDHGHAAVAWLRDESSGGRGYEILRIAPQGGTPFELWLDRSNHLPSRIVEQRAAGEETVKLSEWRRTDNVGTPWRVETELTAAKIHTIETVTNVETDPPLNPARFVLPTAPPVDYIFPAQTVSVELPMKLSNGHVHVEARIGKTVLPMLFDTGAVTTLDQAIVRSLGLGPKGAAAAPNSTIRVADMTVGGVSFRHQSVLVSDLSGLAATEGMPVAGVLGYDLPKRLAVELDYDGRRMVLVNPENFAPPPSASGVPITFQGRLPVVQARIDGVPAKLAIDTSRQAGLTVSPDFAEAHGLAAKWHTRPGQLIGWDRSGAVLGALARTGSLEIGVLGVAQPIAVVPRTPLAGTDGALGGMALRHFDVILDYQHGKIWLQPNGNSGQPDGYDHAGLWINQRDDALTVAAVVPLGPAFRAGLQPGDVIEAVNGDKASAIGLPDLRLRLMGVPGSAVTLGIKRKDEYREARIVLADPLATPASSE